MTARSVAACVGLVTAAATALLLVAPFLVAAPAHAQDISISFGQGAGTGTGLTERVIQLIALLTVLSLAPSILVMMTSFTRIVVVLSLLRTALGTALLCFTLHRVRDTRCPARMKLIEQKGNIPKLA
jgi:flagellar biosynthetic protein FliP